MSRHYQRPQAEVELNVTPMLDMAFQLLAFFILTFSPAPIEGQISLRLPPPQPVTKGVEPAGSDLTNTNPAKGVDTLTISVFADKSGDIGSLGVGESGVAGTSVDAKLAALESRLQEIFADKNNSFEQVIIQVGSNLRYEELMKVVDICTHLKLPGGQRLSKLSFVEVPQG
ncbi:MAG: biopolymer transporter ExbD [Thermoguttaceae bacterium]|jgi:biopolymer transport protein ExbD